jgi:hypothetical protein
MIRDHQGPVDVRGFSVVGVVALCMIGLLAVLRNWTGVAMLFALAIGSTVPVALGGGLDYPAGPPRSFLK